MNNLVREIVTSGPDAKPLTESSTIRWATLMAVGWATQNIVAWLQLDQSTAATVTAGLLGFITFAGALAGTMRRSGIRVPDWVVEILVAASKDSTQ